MDSGNNSRSEPSPPRSWYDWYHQVVLPAAAARGDAVLAEQARRVGAALAETNWQPGALTALSMDEFADRFSLPRCR
ncbi:MAG: hypothetical protein QHH05_07380 [Syntrophomonadaceae bacterium]|jgi:hypothetical protein|nr:hypothetical protein [Syntrophomonadaceae bacterium]MDH7498248.1 hypothetical protein [Syntrophomonadaceae bacterium]